MPDGTNVIYLYDGSFDGLMCCVFESITRREFPEDILPEPLEQLRFGSMRQIVTSRENAARVIKSIPEKISAEALEFIKTAFLTCVEGRDILILKFICKGYRRGRAVLNMLADDTVNALWKANRHCTEEAHLLEGFIRFSDSGGALTAVIDPKNKVLPLIAGHFTDRFRNESFLIFDRTHKMALIYHDYTAEIIEAEDFLPPPANDTEQLYRSLWLTFYDAIGIKERFNPTCRRSHMPKRYWADMTEMRRFVRPNEVTAIDKKTP